MAARSADAAARARALETLMAVYWRPVYGHVRARCRGLEDEAEDLAQGFFATALEKRWLDRFDPARGRFRSYLLACLGGYLANERRARRREKRGGGVRTVSLDHWPTPDGCAELPLAADTDLEEEFQREWARGLFALAVAALRERCEQRRGRALSFRLFERYDIEGADAQARPSYAELAEEHGISQSQVTNHLHWARSELRRIVLAKLRETTASDEEFRLEARVLLGGEP